MQWNRTINLVSSDTLPEWWRRHILDSAQLVSLVKPSGAWIDLGTGGGFPGLVAAILLRDRMTLHLVESNRKKAAFLQAVVGTLRLSTIVHGCRIEAMTPPCANIVSARALAPLPTLFTLSEPWLTRGATAFFMKGRDYRPELAEIADFWEFCLLEHPSQTESGSVVLEFRYVRRKST